MLEVKGRMEAGTGLGAGVSAGGVVRPGGRGGIVVQKFGGSSVASAERMRACAAKVKALAGAGHGVVVVVSAMGDTTDDLLGLAAGVTSSPDRREMDQLLATGEQVSIALMAMCLQGMGVPAVSLTGPQAGVHTDGVHTRALVRTVDRSRLVAELAQGRVPVVAGFQGLCESGDVTTLGRGGSDTTAVALAVALGAAECQIFTDVDGVYSTDPRIEPGARLLRTISYDEMMEAASQGARVMHLRSVEIGMEAGMPIRVLHSQRGAVGVGAAAGGTLICSERTRAHSAMEDRQAISVVALKTDLGRVTLEDLPNVAGIQRTIFERIAAAGISVDDIIQHEVETGAGVDRGQSKPGDRCNIVFTLEKTDLREVEPLIDGVLGEIGQGRRRVDLGLVKVSAIGVGMQSQPGVAAAMFRALADAGIVIHNITTSEIKISCLLAEPDGPRAVRVVHGAFGLTQVATEV